MKGFTVWQPWASLIALRVKPYEFRGWRFPRSYIGRRVAIGAAMRPVREEEIYDLIRRIEDGVPPCLLDGARALLDKALERPRSLPLGHIVCTAVLGEPKPGDACAREFGLDAGNDSDREGTFNWGWPMLEVEALEPPLPWRGRQGFWDVPDELVRPA